MAFRRRRRSRFRRRGMVGRRRRRRFRQKGMNIGHRL